MVREVLFFMCCFSLCRNIKWPPLIFSYSLKKHMLGFAQIISVFHTGWRFACVGVGYPVSGRCSRSSFCKWRTGAWQFLCERIKIKGCIAFLSKVKRKFVNNSGSN